jgi:hypothetical protein
MKSALYLLVLLGLLPAPAAPALRVISGAEPPKEPACQLWEGTAAGNDPSVTLRLTLCEGEAGLYGVVEWSSRSSGWNRRAIEGRRGAKGGLSLHDVRVLEEKPNPGWRFCVIDRYELDPAAPERLEGEYFSEKCRDAAAVKLALKKKAVPPPSLK